MTNSADPDQLASSEANWSGSTLFAKAGHIRSAGLGLRVPSDWTSVVYEYLLKQYENIVYSQTYIKQTPKKKPKRSYTNFPLLGLESSGLNVQMIA